MKWSSFQLVIDASEKDGDKWPKLVVEQRDHFVADSFWYKQAWIACLQYVSEACVNKDENESTLDKSKSMPDGSAQMMLAQFWVRQCLSFSLPLPLATPICTHTCTGVAALHIM